MDVVAIWLARLLAVAGLALACAPVLAAWSASSPEPSRPGSPYRAANTIAGADVSARASRVGALFVGWGVFVTLVVSVLALLVGLASSIRLLAPGRADATPGVILISAAIGAVLIGPALVLFGSRARKGTPTVPMNALALSAFETVLVALGMFAAAFEERAPMPAVAVAALVLAVGLPISGLALFGGAGLRTDQDAALARRRLVGSTLHVALVLVVGVVLALGVADELGDRASNVTTDVALGLLEAQVWTFVLAGVLALGALIDLVTAVVLAMRSPATA
jgi:hypothetical protein